MELTETDYKILSLVRRCGPLDSTAIKSRLPRATISERHLRQLSIPPRYVYPGIITEDRQMLLRKEVDGVSVYSIAPLGLDALRKRHRQQIRDFAKIVVPIISAIVIWLIEQRLERLIR